MYPFQSIHESIKWLEMYLRKKLDKCRKTARILFCEEYAERKKKIRVADVCEKTEL